MARGLASSINKEFSVGLGEDSCIDCLASDQRLAKFTEVTAKADQVRNKIKRIQWPE